MLYINVPESTHNCADNFIQQLKRRVLKDDSIALDILLTNKICLFN